MEEINEKTSVVIVATYYNYDGTAVEPDAASYTLYDKFSGTVRVADTITPSGTSSTIIIDGSYNNILNAYNRYEVASLYVEWIYSGCSGADEYSYKILNLAKVT